MAKPTRTSLVVANERPRAESAANAFQTAANKLGLGWVARPARNGEAVSLETVTVAVAVDLANLVLPGWTGRVEGLTTAPALDLAVNGLLARLLGGNDQAVLPPPSVAPTIPKKSHTVKLSRETAGRRGKGVTVISELPLNEDQLKELATRLKTACGTGGTAKDGRIEIQGDQRDRLSIELEKLGYKVKRAGG